jgi:tRNA A-37 threonylcarbamoyl transferase component Bud32
VSEDLIGKTMGKYELRERIGRGGMAEVYKAYHAALDRYVALKVLHPFLSEDTEFKGRFEREARNVAQLRHPNIVQVYDFDFDPARSLYYMVMEYIDGPTLRAYLMQCSFEGRLAPMEEAIRITRDLANALAYAHSHDMIHRDIKPSNIMIDSDGRVVLTDFGIARIVSGPHMTASGSMVGTPAYMSPEQGLGQPGDHRSDIYSLGVALYQLVTGTTPYDADTPIAIILKHVNDPLPPPSSINPNIPDGLELIIYKALAKSPDERYQNIEEMAHHLDNLAEAAEALAIPPSSAISADVFGRARLGEAADVIAAPAAGPGVPVKRGRGCVSWFALMMLSLIAMIGGIYSSFTGTLGAFVPFLPSAEIVLTETPTPTATLLATGTPLQSTPDAQATEISLTVEALASLVATPPPGDGAIDLTATFVACDYDYEVISEEPENGLTYPELTTLTKKITIVNDSKCPLDDDTRLVFTDGLQLGGPDFIELDRELPPGEEFTIELFLRTPQFNPANPMVRSTWLFILPDGSQVGRPLTIEVLVLSSSEGSNEPTEAPPAGTPSGRTPTSSPPTAAPTDGAPTNSSPAGTSTPDGNT